MDEAQRLENQRLIVIKEDRARREAGHCSLGMWWRIVRGDYPEEFARYSVRRVAVMERACLILLDVARERRPDDPNIWTEEPLTLRIANFKEAYAEEQAMIENRERLQAQTYNGFPTASGSLVWGGDGDRRGPIGWAKLPWRE